MTEFCQNVLRLLSDQGIEFMVGGYDALRHHTGIDRRTKDFDLMVRPSEVDGVLQICRSAGYGVELTYSHWLAKIHDGECFIDLIFNSGNGLCAVDDEWSSRSVPSVILETPVKIIPVEELIWQKAYIMERERFDGADIAHLLLKCGERLDWGRLLSRFGSDWRVLLSHLVLFGFIYPSRRSLIPNGVMNELLPRVNREQQGSPARTNVCNGTLLSRSQYTADIDIDGFEDGRLDERSAMTAREITEWNALGHMEQPSRNVRRT